MEKQNEKSNVATNYRMRVRDRTDTSETASSTNRENFYGKWINIILHSSFWTTAILIEIVIKKSNMKVFQSKRSRVKEGWIEDR